MARVTAGGCSAAQISPEISDDEVFDADKVWRPLRTNGRRPTAPTEPVSQQTLQEVQLERNEESLSDSQISQSSGSQHRMYVDFRGQTVSSDRYEANWNYSDTFSGGNSNNNRPGGLCSVPVSASSMSEDGKPWSDNVSESQELQCGRPHLQRLDRQHSIVDGLLFEIYDRWHVGRTDSFDSDTFTECSSTSEVFHPRWDTYCDYEAAAEDTHAKQLNHSFLESQSVPQLRRMVSDLQRSVGQVSGRLVRQLKRRDRGLAKQARNADVVTAVLQAASLKRQIDTRMKFSLQPPPGLSAFDQWRDAMKAVNRLPTGLPPEFRKKVWLSLADNYIRKLKIDWNKTVRLAFNERSNPDDDKLGLQIVKDLHRTGCSSFSGQDNEQDRAVLKRVLLAYARWNKRIGYCQGFNVIAALLLNVMERKEDDALKVMIYLIDSVLPESYFDNNLRALSVDMAVFRDLLRMTLPTLSRHLDRLQHAAQDVNTGACYEPPLTNVFTMQWFLTLFATCLPKEVVLRVWDAILLEGSEVLLRTALCLWGKLARRMMKVDTADEFYSLMGELSSDMMEGTIFNSDEIIKAIYAIAPFPFPQLSELRDKYTYNIRPFSSAAAPGRRGSRVAKAVLYSDEDDLDEDELRAIASFPGMTPMQGGKTKGVDISLVGPGAYGAQSEPGVGSRDAVYMERMTTDITALKMQYDKLRQRQRQAHVLIAAAASAKKAVQVKQKAQAPVLVPKIETPLAMNHLFVGKVQGGRNRLVTHGPRIAASATTSSTNTSSVPTKQPQTAAGPQSASPAKTTPSAKTTPTIKTTPPSSPEASPSACEEEEEESTTPVPEESTRAVSPAPSGTANDDVEEEGGWAKRSQDGESRQPDGSEKRDSDSEAPESEGGWLAESVLGDDASSTCSGGEGGEEDGYDTYFPSHHHRRGDGEDLGLTLSRVRSCPQAVGRCQSKEEEEEGEEEDSGVVVLSPSPESSPERRRPTGAAVRPTSFLLYVEGCVSEETSAEKKGADDDDINNSSSGSETGKMMMATAGPGHHSAMARSLSAPNGMASGGRVRIRPTLTPATTPTRGQGLGSAPIQVAPVIVSPSQTPLSSPSPSHPPPPSSAPLSSPLKTNRPFNPFPVKHVNTNRAKTGLKLGLYTPSTLEHIQGQLRGVLVAGKKARNTSA